MLWYLLMTCCSLILHVTSTHICVPLRPWCCVISVPTPSTSATSQPTNSSSSTNSTTSIPTTTSQPSPLFDYQIIIIGVVCGVVAVGIVIVIVVVCYRRRKGNKPERSGNSHMDNTTYTDITQFWVIWTLLVVLMT